MPRRSPSELAAYLNQVAEELRANPTEAELAVRDRLLELGLEFQSPMLWHTKNGGYGGAVFDFYHSSGLIVEIDGSSHDKRKGKDRRHDTRFGTEGLRTLRISNRRALKETEAVIAEIRAEIKR